MSIKAWDTGVNPNYKSTHMPTVQLKRLGKKKVKEIPYELDSSICSLKSLLEACVTAEVSTYNTQKESAQLLPFLTVEEIQQQSNQGKVSFGDSQNNILADQVESIQNVIQAFEDGLFVVFINDNEIKTLDEKIAIDKETVISFMRMTFLTGTYW